MDRKQFSIRFKEAIELTVEKTENLCFNKIGPDFKFIVSPNDSKTQVLLDETELAYIKTLKELNKKPLLFDEVLDLIQVGERNPLWINISVYEVNPEFTYIELICARRLRKVEDVLNDIDKFPPFHVWVAEPANTISLKVNYKLDINWRSRADKRGKGLLDQVKYYFSGE